MTLQMKRILTSAFFSIMVVGVVWAGSVTLPNTFTAGTTARAAEVNANFTAVKTAVDDNHTRITRLETIEAFAAPTFLTGWSNYGTPFAPAGYMKDPMGFVHLRGHVQRTSGSPGNIYSLPAGYRPAYNLVFPARCGDNTMCAVIVNTNGNVDLAAGTGNQGLTLDGITFDLR